MIKKKKPEFSKAHRKNRLNWALSNQSWTNEDWKRVFWSDETKINRLNSGGIQYSWAKDSKNFELNAVEETLKFGGGSLMLWGCTSWYGVGGMGRVGGEDTKQLLEILDATADKPAGPCSLS